MSEVAHQNTHEFERVTHTSQSLNGTPSEVKNQRIEVVKYWLIQASVAVRSWQDELSIDYYRSLELSDATDLKIIAESLREGLSKYIFGDHAYLKEIDSLAWQGLQGRWPDIRKAIARFLRVINKYRDWLQLLKDRDSRIVDPLILRDMVNQMNADTEIIIAEYADLVGKIRPMVEEALQFLR